MFRRHALFNEHVRKKHMESSTCLHIAWLFYLVGSVIALIRQLWHLLSSSFFAACFLPPSVWLFFFFLVVLLLSVFSCGFSFLCFVLGVGSCFWRGRFLLVLFFVGFACGFLFSAWVGSLFLARVGSCSRCLWGFLFGRVWVSSFVSFWVVVGRLPSCSGRKSAK